MVGFGITALPIAGQEPPQPDWAFESEIGASVFFGASDQTTVAVKLGADRSATAFELENDFAFVYGEAANDAGERFVNRRLWEVSSNLSFREYSRVNPYLFGSALSSLEKKIHRRYKGGAGAKVTALDSEVSQLDFGMAMLAEMTVEDCPDNGDQQLLARWSGEMDYRRTFSDERVVVAAELEYNPVFDEFANFTINAESSVAFQLTEIVSLKLSVVDQYDSRAEKRGARSNNDGRVLFSVLSAF